LAPPAAWKGAAKTNWGRLPPAIKEQIRNDVDALEKDRAEVAPLREMLDQNRGFLINEAGTVFEGVRQLLAFARMSVDSPVELINHIARQRGINLAALVGQPGQPGTQQAPDPNHPLVAQQRRIEALEARLASQHDTTARDQIAAFSANPAYPFFQDVRQQMGALMEAGQAKTLEQAYEMAAWANPQIRAQLLAQQAEQAQAVKAAELARAKAANAANLTGSPAVAGARPNGAGGQPDSIRDSLVSAFRDHQGGV
jgi:hypothetical protein